MAQYTTSLAVFSKRILPIASPPLVLCHGEPLSYSRSKTKVKTATPAKHATRSSVPRPLPPPKAPHPHNPRNKTGAKQMNATFDRTTLCGWSDSQTTWKRENRGYAILCQGTIRLSTVILRSTHDLVANCKLVGTTVKVRIIARDAVISSLCDKYPRQD